MFEPDFHYKPPAYITALTLDAMYYHAARKCYDKARKAEPRVQRALKQFERLEDRSQRILVKNEGDAYKAYDKLEGIYIQMQGASERIAFAYSPLLEGVACTHILCAAALEGHINSRANELLTGKLHRKFEWIDLELKWLLLPRLVGKGGFDPGAEPFQGFSRLVKVRNALVHYRERKEPWKDPGIPTFLESLGLTIADAAKSLECVSAMISIFAEQLNQEVPYWLRRDTGEIVCFDFRCEDPAQPTPGKDG